MWFIRVFLSLLGATGFVTSLAWTLGGGTEISRAGYVAMALAVRSATMDKVGHALLGRGQSRDLESLSEARHESRGEWPCPPGLRSCQIGLLPHELPTHPARFRTGTRQGNGGHGNALRPIRLRISLHAAPDPQRGTIIAFGNKVSTANADTGDMSQRLERHEMKRHPKFADGSVAVPEIS